MRNYLIILILSVIIGMTPVFSQEYIIPQDQESVIIPNEFIVTFKQPINVVSNQLIFGGIEIQLQSLETYTGRNQVFLAKTDESNLSIILSDPRVQYVEPNRLLYLHGFSGDMSFGKDRIEADLRVNYADGIDDKTDADVAVMDTGILETNPDYNIIVCIDFTGSGTCGDNNGHGSHTAGTVGAKDNGGNGIIGVAEGVRLHILKVCATISCSTAAMAAAGDYVTANSDVIDVVNVSIGGAMSVPNTSCDSSVTSALQRSFCNGYEKGVIYVVSAGNSFSDSSNRAIPCTWDSVLCVSAMTDSDGESGGVGSPPSCRPAEVDDRMASFSNFGEVVRIIAPGVCEASYDRLGNVSRLSGTSMSSPHVAGSAALATIDFLNPTNAAEVELVRQFLIDEGFPRDSPNGWTGDKDNFADPLVQVAFGQTPPPPPDDQDSPRTGIWKPRNGDTITGIQTVSFWAIDNEGSIPVLTCFEVDGVIQECKNPSSNGIDTHFSWDSRGVSDGVRTLGGQVCDAVSNCVFVPTKDVIVSNFSLEDKVAKNTADITNHEQRITSLEAGGQGILNEDGGNQGILILTITIGWITISVIIWVSRKKS